MFIKNLYGPRKSDYFTNMEIIIVIEKLLIAIMLQKADKNGAYSKYMQIKKIEINQSCHEN